MKLVSNQLAPNFTLADALHAARQIAGGENPDRSECAEFFGTEKFQLLNAARTALSLIAEKVNPKKKVGIPAFCCGVMATPFLQRNLEIEWIDTDTQGLISVKDFEKKSDQISLVLIPHIFGQRAPVEAIAKIARQKNMVTVEDGAHLFEPGCEKTDFKILSFGREKDVSCVSGGALLWSENFEEKPLPLPPKAWTVRHLLQPLTFALSLPWWDRGGKLIAAAGQKLWLPRAVTAVEKRGSEDFPQAQMPPAIQRVLRRQLERRDRELSRRKQLASAWQEVLGKTFAEANIIIPDNALRVIMHGVERKEVLEKARKIGFHLNDWDGVPIAPAGVNLEKFGYTPGQCPAAEKFAKNYVTFPTNRRTNLADIEKFGRLYGTK